MSIELHNMDCMLAMAEMPDNAFDLAIVDPEYGIDAGNPSKKPCKVRQKNGSILPTPKSTYKTGGWDKTPCNENVINEIVRVSKRQIVWGANYLGLKGGVLIWQKLNGESDQYDAEIAWLSWTNAIRTVYYLWAGMFQGENLSTKPIKALNQIGNKSLNEKRIHPTQKPVKLYEWLLTNYANEGDTILDTHLGSGSIAIACHNLGFSLTGFELDPDYFNAAKKRLQQHQAQQRINFA